MCTVDGNRFIHLQKDPFKQSSGGFVDMQKMTDEDLKNSNIEETIKANYTKERALRDEDDEM